MRKRIDLKKTFLLCVAVVLTGVFNFIHAQDNNKALSAQYKNEIAILNLEIKAAKLKLKGDPRNRELSADLRNKQTQLKQAKSNKKTVDKAIKSKAAAEKAAKKAERAENAVQKRTGTERIKEN